MLIGWSMIVYDIRVHDDLFLRDGAGKIIFKICGLPPHPPPNPLVAMILKIIYNPSLSRGKLSCLFLKFHSTRIPQALFLLGVFWADGHMNTSYKYNCLFDSFTVTAVTGGWAQQRFPELIFWDTHFLELSLVYMELSLVFSICTLNRMFLNSVYEMMAQMLINFVPGGGTQSRGGADEWSAAVHPWVLDRCKRIQLNVLGSHMWPYQAWCITKGMGHKCKLFIAEQWLKSTGSAPGRLSILCSTVGHVGEETWFRNGEASREFY